MVIAGARDFGRHNPLMRLFDEVNRYIVHEDQAIVESSLPLEVPRQAAERSVATDHLSGVCTRSSGLKLVDGWSLDPDSL